MKASSYSIQRPAGLYTIAAGGVSWSMQWGSWSRLSPCMIVGCAAMQSPLGFGPFVGHSRLVKNVSFGVSGSTLFGQIYRIADPLLLLPHSYDEAV